MRGEFIKNFLINFGKVYQYLNKHHNGYTHIYENNINMSYIDCSYNLSTINESNVKLNQNNQTFYFGTKADNVI